MTETPTDSPVPHASEDSVAALALVPRLLVALAGACTLAGVVGIVSIVLGHGAPPLPVLLVPPVLVLLAVPVLVLRAGKKGVVEEVES